MDGAIIVAGIADQIDPTTGRGNADHPLLMRFYGDTSAPAASGSSLTVASAADATDTALMLMLTDSSTTTAKRK